MRWRRALSITLVTTLAIAVVGVGGLFVFQDQTAEAVRRLIVQQLEAATDRDVAIGGEFDLVPSLTPTLAAEDLVVANADWGSQPAMLTAERVEVELQLMPLLLDGDVLIDRLVLIGADVLLERGPEGAFNWRFDDDSAPPEPNATQRTFLLDEVAIENSRVRWHDKAHERSEIVLVDWLGWQADSTTSALAISGAGTFEQQPFTLAGELGQIATLRQAKEPYPVALQLAFDGLEVALDGQLSPGREAQLEVQAAGDSLASVAALLGRDLPEIRELAIEGTLSGPPDALSLADLSGWLALGADPASRIEIIGGQIANLTTGDGLQMPLAADGDELGALAEALGIEMAAFGPFSFQGTLTGSYDRLDLRNISALAGDEATRIDVTGSIGDLIALGDLDLSVTIAGDSLAALSPIARTDLPETEPFSMKGQISGSRADLRVEDLTTDLANSTVSGRLRVQRTDDETPRVAGELEANRLDIDRILALADRVVDEETVAESPAGENQIFSTDPLPLEVLEELQADLLLRAAEVIIDATAFTDARVQVLLQDGLLSLQDLVLHVGGGEVAGGATVDAEAGMADVSVRLSADDVAVEDLLLGATEKVTGEVDIDISIDSTGRSLDELMAELQGTAAVAAEGEIADTRLNRLVADLDLIKALPPFWPRDNAVRVNCLIGEFDIVDGVVQTAAMLDTERMTLVGEGTVDLGDETLDLELRPLPKQQKLSTVAIPLDIEGSLKHPEVRPRTGTAAARAVRGILGGLLLPLNQIAALFGEEATDACAVALRQAQERREPSDTNG